MLEGLLEAMRDSVEKTLSTPVTVRRRSRSRTATGGSSYSHTDTEETTGRLMATSDRELEFASKMGISATHALILPWDVGVRVDDMVRVGGVDYAVTGVMSHEETVLKKVLCARVEE